MAEVGRLTSMLFWTSATDVPVSSLDTFVKELLHRAHSPFAEAAGGVVPSPRHARRRAVTLDDVLAELERREGMSGIAEKAGR